MKAGIADLPGDRNSKEMFTTAQKPGKYVATALDLQKRKEDTVMKLAYISQLQRLGKL